MMAAIRTAANAHQTADKKVGDQYEMHRAELRQILCLGQQQQQQQLAVISLRCCNAHTFMHRLYTTAAHLNWQNNTHAACMSHIARRRVTASAAPRPAPALTNELARCARLCATDNLRISITALVTAGLQCSPAAIGTAIATAMLRRCVAETAAAASPCSAASTSSFTQASGLSWHDVVTVF
jgi:hypothetical protein